MSSGSGCVREAQADKWCAADSQAPRPQEAFSIKASDRSEPGTSKPDSA